MAVDPEHATGRLVFDGRESLFRAYLRRDLARHPERFARTQ
jgi:hypothetical protein